MLKTLLRKQLLELNQGFFQDKRTGKARSKVGVIILIALYAVLVAGVLGGTFYFLATTICGPLVQTGMGWLYFILFTLIGVFLGVFGSVFNTYSGLYCAKDNDLLLSMPIPVRYILAVRLIGVYLMGLMFSAAVMLPAAIVYWIMVPCTLEGIMGPAVLMLGVSLLVMVLSCILGYGVARLSRKLKNKSMATVALSLLFIAAYYVVYFKANEMIRYLAANAAEIGGELKTSAYILYLVGCVGEGNPWSMLGFMAAMLLALFLTCWVIARSFIRIATSSGNGDRKVYREKTARVRSLSRALLSRELSHLTSSANYMLNCSMGTLFMVVAAVLLVIKGQDMVEALYQITGGDPSRIALLIGAGASAMASMNDLTAPSVSLEGRSVWVIQSLPVKPWAALKAKIQMQLILTSPSLLILQLAALTVCRLRGAALVWVLLFPQAFMLLTAGFGLFLNLKHPNLKWSSEISVIKQGLPPSFALLGGWVYGGAMLLPQLLKPDLMNADLYMWLWLGLTAALTAVLYRWLKRRGSAIFAAL